MSEIMFAFLLSLYPPGFREKYFQEAMLLYRDRYRHETGLFRRTRLWYDLLADLVTGLPRAWQTPCSVVAVPSESRILNGPSFHLFHFEPLRPTVILAGGMLALGIVGALTFVLRTAALHPIQFNTMSPIELVMNRVNQPASRETEDRALPSGWVAGSVTPLTEQAGAHKGAITAGVTVARPHAGKSIRERRAQNLPGARRPESYHANDGRVLPTSNQGSIVHPVRITTSSPGLNVTMAGYQNNSSASHEQERSENTTRAMMQAESEDPARSTARETYVSLPLAEVQNLLSGDCATIRTSHELPDQIKNVFATITHTKPFALADSGAGFNASSLIAPGLPGRRLVLAGRCQDRWFIEYEHGGIAKSVALTVFRTNPDKSVTFVWGRQLKSSARDLARLRAVLVNAAFWDRPYSW
jgi:hypothetical protein